MNHHPPPLVPDTFFADAAEVKPITNVFGDKGRRWMPSSAMMWYDGIIDDMFANPGTTWADLARRLGRSHAVISTIVTSDLFKARYAQRRADFDRAIQEKLTGKLVQVASAALDHTLTVLEKKRESIPLPQLQEITNASLDRLGYAPQKHVPQTVVNVTQQNAGVVSPEALARAREHLRSIEGPSWSGSPERLVDPEDPLRSRLVDPEALAKPPSRLVDPGGQTRSAPSGASPPFDEVSGPPAQQPSRSERPQSTLSLSEAEAAPKGLVGQGQPLSGSGSQNPEAVVAGRPPREEGEG